MNRTCIPILLLITLLLLSAGIASAHMNDEPVVGLRYDLNETELKCVINFNELLLFDITGHPQFDPDSILRADLIDQAPILAFIKEHIQTEIDGIVVLPVYTKKQFSTLGSEVQEVYPLQQWMVGITVKYPLISDPRSISIACLKSDLFDHIEAISKENALKTGAPGGDLLDAVAFSGLFFAGAKVDGFYLSREEPGYIWHRPGEIQKNVIAEISVDSVGANLKIICVPLFFASLAWAGIFIIITVVSKGRRPVKIFIMITLFCIFVASGSLALIKTQKAGIPEADVATEIFAALHKNIYRSFDYQNESDIYDSLAQSVSGPILDDIYNTVYRGLIMKDEGGAVCVVDKVNTLNTIFIAPLETDQLDYQVQCDWQIIGMVNHWGHTHRRANEYSASYTISAIDQQWRITDSKVTKQQRVDK
jgi:hypothetical protein